MDQLEVDEPSLIGLWIVKQIFKVRIAMGPIVSKLARPETVGSASFFARGFNCLNCERRFNPPFS